MAVTNTPIFPQSVQNWVQKITNANGTTVETVVSGGTNGSKVENLILTQNSSTALTAQIWMTISSVAYLIGTVTVPANAGNTTSAPSVSVLNSAQIPGIPVDSNGNSYLYVPSGATLGVGLTTAVASGDFCYCFAQGGNF